MVAAGCDPSATGNAPPPLAPPADFASAVSAPTPESMAMRKYYADIQQNFLTQGLLRTDGGGPDTPLSRRRLVEDFIQIALFEEFSRSAGQLVPRPVATTLHRWEQPVRMRLRFGDSIPLVQRNADRAFVAAYVARLSRVTGLPITQSSVNANFHVFVVNEDERRRIGPRIRAVIPDISPADIAKVEGMQPSTFCLVLARDAGDSGAYAQAVAVIRGEHPDLLRQSCFHEELSQGLGLGNDSPNARPSIFNDDEEFGFLTTHDELLLRMLYDPRMQTGMTAAQARPIAEQIAAELLGGAG